VPGYGLRPFRPGDEEAWLAILLTGQFDRWDRARLDRMLAAESPRVPLDGIFFATRQGRPVGTASTYLYPDPAGEVAELGWVAVLPEHRGHGLAMQACRAVLGYMRAHGHRYAFLRTEDFRLAAIKTYLRLGFEPEMTDPSHPGRWEEIRRALAAGGPA
jgi:mycothiol synthase